LGSIALIGNACNLFERQCPSAQQEALGTGALAVQASAAQ